MVPISPVDGLWHCTFTGPEDTAVAVEIVADLSILSEKFIAHVHSSGFQSLILGTQLGGPAGPILSVRGVGSGSHGVFKAFTASVETGKVCPWGELCGCYASKNDGPSSANSYAERSWSAKLWIHGWQSLPAGAGPAPSGFGAQSGFMHSPRSFVMGNYYMTPYGHQVPYDSSAVVAQQHPLAPPGAASKGAIPPTAQMQAAEAAACAAAEAGQSAGIVNPGGVGSMPKGAGGYGGHRAAVGAGGTSGAAVPIVSNSSSPDGISSMHQAHLRGQHSGRRSSQSSGHGQQHSQQNGTMATVNGLSYNQSGFEGSMPSAASRTGPSHGTKWIVSSTGISSHGMVSGASVELAPGKALHGGAPDIGNGASGVNRSRSIQNGSVLISVHSPGLVMDLANH
jgi:hypothetical protein